MPEWHDILYQGTSGERADSVLTRMLAELPGLEGLSRARVQALIDAGGVRLNETEISRGQKKLRPGMLVQVDLDMLRAQIRPPAPSDLAPVDLSIEVLYSDGQLAVVNKPPGISTHPSPTDSGPTLAGALLHRFGSLSDEGGPERPGIVHRLDKETSGLLVIARDNLAHSALSRQFAQRMVEKEYLALCLDPPRSELGRIDLPIERHPRDRKKMWAGGHGKPALSEYRLRSDWGPLALLDVAIHSGRTHQIRVHLQAIGIAILNDMKYGEARNGSLRRWLKGGSDAGLRSGWKQAFDGDPGPARERRSAVLGLLLSYPGIFLHSHRLGFIHPGTGQSLSFRADPPPAWSALAGALGLDEPSAGLSRLQ
jgi:23S rRNA pseudouridine1911/1915/1917 synthase